MLCFRRAGQFRAIHLARSSSSPSSSSSSSSSSSAWHQLSGLLQAGRLSEMESLFARVADEAGRGCFKLMLQRSRALGDWRSAVSVFERLVSRDELPDEAMFHFLIETLLDCQRVREAMAYIGLQTPYRSEEDDDAEDEKKKESTPIRVSSSLLLSLPDSSVVAPLLSRVVSQRGADETAEQHLRRVLRVVEELSRRQMRMPGLVWAAVMRARVRCDDRTPVIELVRSTLQMAGDRGERGYSIDPVLLEAGMMCLVESSNRELAWLLFEQHEEAVLAEADLSQRGAHRWLVAVLRCAPSFAAARLVLEKLIKLGFRPDAFTFHCLLLCLCRDTHETDRVRLARKTVLQPLKERRLELFEHTPTAIAALRLTEEQVSWKDVLGSPASSQERTIGALMELLLQMGKRELVLQIWDEAFCGEGASKMKPGEKVFLAAVRACLSRMPRGNMVLDPRYESVLARLAEAKLKPSEELLVATLRVEGLGGKSERAVATFDAILRGQLGDFRASRGVIRAMVETLGHNQDGAKLVPRLLELASTSYKIPIDIDLYNLWISACRFGAQEPPTPEDVLGLYHTIKSKGVTPNAVTYNSLFALMDQVPHNLDVSRHVHYLLHDWWRISEHAGKDSVTNNLLLRVLGSRETAQSRLVCHRIFAFMNASSDPAQWPDGYTYHALIKGLVRSGQFRRAVQAMQEAMEKTEERRRTSGKQPEGPWRHTVEYLMGNLLGEGKMDLALRLREVMAKHGFIMGCPLPNMEDDD